MEINKKKWLNDIADKLFNYVPVCDAVRHLIACQFALESDFGRSSAARYFYNISGMSFPKRRLTLAIYVTNKPYACYDSIEDCLIDYALYLAYWRIQPKETQSVDGFCRFLTRVNYCPASTYTDSVKSIYKQYYENQ